jgi:MFS family permease
LRKSASASLVFGLGFAGLACGLATFVLAPTWTIALCGYGLFGGAMGLVVANMYAVGSHAANPDHRGAALGQTLAAYYAAPLVAQLLLEPLSGGRPIQALMWLAGFSAVMCVTWLTLTARSRADTPLRAV